MEKAIKLIMHNDKTIKVFVNDEEKHTIEAQNRSISADKVYEMIGFEIGDHYTVCSENTENVDVQVLEFFADLLKDIVEKVNAFGEVAETEEATEGNFSFD